MTSHYPLTTILQADATLSQANPISGTKYTVLATTTNVKIKQMYAKVVWTVQPNPLEIHCTVDGNQVVFKASNPTTNQAYIALQNPTENPTSGLTMPAAGSPQSYLFADIEGRSVKVEAETTGGTTSNLSARIRYNRW